MTAISTRCSTCNGTTAGRFTFGRSIPKRLKAAGSLRATIALAAPRDAAQAAVGRWSLSLRLVRAPQKPRVAAPRSLKSFVASPAWPATNGELISNHAGSFIDLEIVLARSVPGEIGLHRVLPVLVEQFRLLIKHEGFADRLGEGADGIFHELDSVCLRRVFGNVDHRVVESAGDTHDGNRRVAQAVHLVQPARFVTRRHDKKIRPGLDAVGQPFVEADFDGDLPGEAPGQDLEGPFVMGRAAAEQDKMKLRREHLLQ